jgi:bacteriocin-like protein
MNAYDNYAHFDALSDNELDAVSGGDKMTVEEVKAAIAAWPKDPGPTWLTPAAIAEAAKGLKPMT